MLRCLACGKLTTEYEARLSKFNKGRCAYCNGELATEAPIPKSTHPESLAQIQRRILSRLVVDQE